MASTLSDQVVPACEGAPQHAARVVANLCQVLAREATLGQVNEAASIESLQALLGDDSTELSALVDQLDKALAGPTPPVGGQVHSTLLANVERRLDIAKPTYR